MALYFHSDEASQGGYGSIMAVEGDLITLEEVDSSFGDGTTQVQFILENATILEVKEGEAEPTLIDEMFKGWVKFAKRRGLKAHKNSPYNKGFITSAEALGLELIEVCPEKPIHVILERQDVELGFKDAEDKPVTANTWVFTSAAGGKQSAEALEDLTIRAANLLDGKTKSLAIRKFMEDDKLKRNKEYLAAIKDDTIDTLVPVTMVDGKYAKIEE